MGQLLMEGTGCKGKELKLSLTEIIFTSNKAKLLFSVYELTRSVKSLGRVSSTQCLSRRVREPVWEGGLPDPVKLAVAGAL